MLSDRCDPHSHTLSPWICICTHSGTLLASPCSWARCPLNPQTIIPACLTCALDLKRHRGHLLGVGHFSPVAICDIIVDVFSCRSPVTHFSSSCRLLLSVTCDPPTFWRPRCPPFSDVSICFRGCVYYHPLLVNDFPKLLLATTEIHILI